MAKSTNHAPDKDGYYRHTFYFEGKQFSARSKVSHAEAIKKAAVKEDRLRRGEDGITSNMTVKAWGKVYLETYRKPKISDGTYKAELARLENIVVPAIGAMRLKDVTGVHCQRILNSREGMSSSEIGKTKTLLKGMFRRAKKEWPMLNNPADDLDTPTGTEGSSRQITGRERESSLRVAEWHRGGLWVLTMLYCGLRPIETRHIQGKDVDLKSGYLSVRRSKTKAGERKVPIPAHFAHALSGFKPNDFLFTQASGNPHTKTSLKQMWDSFKRAVDIDMGARTDRRGKVVISIVADDLHPYCYRHTFCTDLELAGVPINIAKYLMGHKDIRTTSRFYTHQTDDALEIARSFINAKHG